MVRLRIFILLNFCVKLVTSEFDLPSDAPLDMPGVDRFNEDDYIFTYDEHNSTVAIALSANYVRKIQSKKIYYNDEQFLEMSEFDYGQQAMYLEPCDFDLYKKYLGTMFGRMYEMSSKSLTENWVADQQNYAEAMRKNHSLRALTCHAPHLMECSSKENDNGEHTCKCLKLFPLYNLKMDKETRECRAQVGARCFTPFGLKCFNNSVCKQTRRTTGECICERKSKLLSNETEDNCSGYSTDVDSTFLYLDNLSRPPSFSKEAESYRELILESYEQRLGGDTRKRKNSKTSYFF